MNGPNKLLLDLHGQTIIERTYNQLSESKVDEIIVVTGRDHALIEGSLALRPSDSFVHNPDFTSGMTSSIQSGVKFASGDAYMICLGDMPFLKADHYDRLFNQFKKAVFSNPMSILLPMVNGRRGNPVIFSRAYKEAILSHTEMNGCRLLIQDNLNHLVEYITDDRAYLSDIDTAEDYLQLDQ